VVESYQHNGRVQSPQITVLLEIKDHAMKEQHQHSDSILKKTVENTLMIVDRNSWLAVSTLNVTV
jgi:hypothetical protein